MIRPPPRSTLLPYTTPFRSTGAVDPNYTISYVHGTLTVNPVALTITADDQAKDYGAALPTFTYSGTDVHTSDTKALLTTERTLTLEATASSPAGTYAINCTGAVDPNYTISYVHGTLTRNPAPLTITADDQAKDYGAALPTFTYSASGFVNGDTKASLTTQPTCTTAATASSPAGTYAINCTGAVDPNYTISYVHGTLTVNPVALTITADDQAKDYIASLHT